MLTRDQILAAPDLPYEDVDIPEWGGTVRLRALTGSEVEAISQAAATDQVGTIRRALGYCLVDENLVRLFSDEDLDALWEKNASILMKLGLIGLRLSNLDPDSNQELMATFAGAPTGDSTSG